MSEARTTKGERRVYVEDAGRRGKGGIQMAEERGLFCGEGIDAEDENEKFGAMRLALCEEAGASILHREILR